MHELSLAFSIVDIVEENVKKNNGKVATAVTIEIGTMSGVLPHLLEFAMEEAKQNTLLQGASINIHPVQAKATCHQCHFNFDINDIYTPCPACKSLDIEVVSGKDMIVKSISIE